MDPDPSTMIDEGKGLWMGISKDQKCFVDRNLINVLPTSQSKDLKTKYRN